MKRFIFLNLLLGIISFFFSLSNNSIYAQETYGTQFRNMGFENWANYVNNDNDTYEPLYWHSFKSGDGSLINSTKPCLERSTSVRPGSVGSYSARMSVKTVLLFFKQNGSLLSGRMYASSASLENPGNYLYTDRSKDEFRNPINTIPDSITVWVCARLKNSSDKAFIHCAVHGESDFQLVSDGTYNPTNMLVAKGDLIFTRTSAHDVSPLVWERKSVPFVVDDECVCTDPKYILASFSTNHKAGSGTTSDDVFVDDVLLIYNPTRSVGTLAQSIYTRPIGGGSLPISIPFTLEGTMSPYNLNAAPNIVYAELSDSNGSFSNPTILGNLTTNSSGVISGTIPANIPNGTGYKVRIRTTNYFGVSPAGPTTITINTAAQQYIVTTSANPTDGGTTSGDNTYSVGTSVTVIAAPAVGYSFTNWTENGQQVCATANYNFIIEDNRNLVANFDRIYTIIATANPSAGGTITGAGEYIENTQVILNASVNNGYRFVNWTENDQQVHTSALYQFNATQDRTLKANFIKRYTVETSANPTNGGTVLGAGTYDEGDEVIVTAVANSGYEFLNWTENGNIVSNENTYTFNIESDRGLTANFIARYDLILTVNPTGAGTASGAGTYTSGTPVTVAATANTGYVFLKWTTDTGQTVSTDSEYTFTITSNTTLIADFQAIPTYNISATANPSAGGIIIGTGTYYQGDNVTLSATANSGYEFENWTENGTIVSSNSEYTFTAEDDRSLIANFNALIEGYTIVLISNPQNGGILTGGGIYEEGTEITVNAQTNNNYEFINWTENDVVISAEPLFTFTVESDRILTANFEYHTPSYDITLISSPTDGGILSGEGNYEEGTEITIEASPNIGYEFINWTENDLLISTELSYSFIVNSDRTIVANFKKVYLIEVISNPEFGGNVSGGGNYYHGDQVIVVAEALGEHIFVNWTENGNIVSNSYCYSFEATSDRTLVANFSESLLYSVNISCNPVDAGIISGEGVYIPDTEVTIIALPNEGYKFIGWFEDGEIVSEISEYMFIVERNRNLAANFEEVLYITINVINKNPDAGIVIGAGKYEIGTETTLTAIPNTNYSFIAWYSEDGLISENPVLSITAEKNLELTVSFKYTSIEDYIIQGLNYYPNPANDYIIVDSEYEIQKIEIFNLGGKFINSIDVKSCHTKINTSYLTQGNYILRFNLENVIVNKMLIISK